MDDATDDAASSIPSGDRDGWVVVHPGPWKLLARAGIGIGFLTLAGLVFTHTIDASAEMTVMAILVAPFGLVFLLDALHRVVGRTPILVANQDGILRIRLLHLLDYVVPWAQVLDIVVHRHTLRHGLLIKHTSTNLVVLLRDPAQLMCRASLARRLVHRIECLVAAPFGGSPVAVGELDTDRPLEELRVRLLALRARHADGEASGGGMGKHQGKGKTPRCRPNPRAGSPHRCCDDLVPVARGSKGGVAGRSDTTGADARQRSERRRDRPLHKGHRLGQAGEAIPGHRL